MQQIILALDLLAILSLGGIILIRCQGVRWRSIKVVLTSPLSRGLELYIIWSTGVGAPWLWFHFSH